MEQPTLPNLKERETLIDIRDSALAHADTVANEHWKEAYKRLASAADHLDAMIARSTFNGNVEVTKHDDL